MSKLNASGTALIYSTFLGGGGSDIAWAVAVDSAGSAYLTGMTDSDDFPTKNAFQPANPGNTLQGQSSLAFVTKFSPSGSALMYSSYLGGGCGIPGVSACMISRKESGRAIAVDDQGHAYVAGALRSARFSLVNSIEAGGGDVDTGWFVSQVSRGGSALLYSTLLGGSSESATNTSFGTRVSETDAAYGLALDASRNLYVAGITSRTTFPVTAGSFQQANGGEFDGAVIKLPRSTAAVSISSSENPSTAGQAVTLTATVAGASAGGNVTFLDGTNVLGSVDASDGTATFTTSLATGVHPLVAIYRDAINQADTLILYQVVDQPAVCN